MATLWNAVSGWMSTDRTPNDVKKASVCTTECVKQLVDDKSWTPLMHWRTGQKDGEIELGEMHCADSRLDIHCDHLFLVFVKIGLVEECALFANMKEGSVKTVWKLGMEVCGHRGLVHGGLSASVMDETLGGCIATLVEGGALPKETGPVVTAHLGVDYCRPLPAGSEIVCTAQLASVEGRKIWLQVDIRDLHDPEVVYVKGKSLFLKIPKDKLMAAQAAPKEQPAQPQQQEQQEQPLEGAQGCGGAVKLPEGGKEERYRTLCSHIGLDADSDLLL